MFICFCDFFVPVLYLGKKYQTLQLYILKYNMKSCCLDLELYSFFYNFLRSGLWSRR